MNIKYQGVEQENEIQACESRGLIKMATTLKTWENEDDLLAQLRWRTRIEMITEHFEVERSKHPTSHNMVKENKKGSKPLLSNIRVLSL